MECSQDLLQLDNEIGRINIMRDSHSSLPVLPSPDILEDFRTGLNTSPATPPHSPHAFLKEDRWLFSPPPVLAMIHTRFEAKSTPNVLGKSGTEKEKKSKPPPLLQIVSHPAPDLVKRLTTSRVPYMSSPVCQTFRK